MLPSDKSISWSCAATLSCRWHWLDRNVTMISTTVMCINSLKGLVNVKLPIFIRTSNNLQRHLDVPNINLERQVPKVLRHWRLTFSYFVPCWLTCIDGICYSEEPYGDIYFYLKINKVRYLTMLMILARASQYTNIFGDSITRILH